MVTFQESKKQSTDSHHSQRPVRSVNDFEIDVSEGDGYDDSGENIRGVSYPKKQTGSKAPVVCTNSEKTPISTTTNDSTLKQNIIAEITQLLQNKSISIYLDGRYNFSKLESS